MSPEAKPLLLPIPPFQRDGQGRYFFVPYGPFGTRYLVGDEAAYRRLEPVRLWTRTMLTAALVVIFVNTVSRLVEEAEILQQVVPFLAAITIIIAYAVRARCLAHILSVEQPRPKFAHMFRDLAYRADTALLWGIQVACLAVTYFLATNVSRHPWGLPSLLNALYAAIFATAALICGLMLVIGSRRVAVRR